jgi:hypothetical protein
MEMRFIVQAGREGARAGARFARTAGFAAGRAAGFRTGVALLRAGVVFTGERFVLGKGTGLSSNLFSTLYHYGSG